MNSKCTFCGHDSDCIPFDGGFCPGLDKPIIPFNVDLTIMEMGKVTNPSLWPARYFVRYVHEYGETIGYYSRYGGLIKSTGEQVWIPEVIIHEQMTMTVNELEALFDRTKEMISKWHKLPMAA